MLLFGTFDDLIAPTISVLSWVASLVGNDLHASSVATMMSFLGMRCGVIAKFKPFDRTSLILVEFVFEKINNPPFYLCTTKIWFWKFIFADFEIELASLSYCLHFACLCTLSWTLVRCAFNCCWTSLGNRSAKRRFLSCRWFIFWFVSRIDRLSKKVLSGLLYNVSCFVGINRAL